MQTLVREIEREWLQFIANNDKLVGPSMSDLSDLLKLQVDYYNQLLHSISNIVTENGRSRGTEGASYISSMISQMHSESRITQDGDLFHLQGPLPILTRGKLDNLLSLIGQHQASISKNTTKHVDPRLAYYIYSGLYFSFKMYHFSSDPLRGQDFLQFDLLRFQSDYSVYIGARDGLAGAISELERHRLSFDEQVKETRAELKTTSEKIENLNLDVIRSEESSVKAQKSTEAKYDDIEKKLFAHKAEVENFAEVVKEKLSLNELGKLWVGVASRAIISLSISGFVIILMCFSGAVFAWFFGTRIVNFALGYSNANIFRFLLGDMSFGHILARLLIVTPPIILYFWLFKIVIRFFIRSLALYDDAIQRKTIMDTYLFLREMGKLDENVMPLIIWSLCRQVPGHGPDGIDPPDFSEAINAGWKLKAATP